MAANHAKAEAMGRMWELKPDVFAWNLERCEEVILIAGYEEIKPFIPSTDTWTVDFENHFYHHGNGVAFYFLDYINAARRRRNLQKLEFNETDVLDYGRLSDKTMKSEYRQRVRDELKGATTSERLQRLSRAVEEAGQLRPPHIPYAEYKQRQSRFSEDSLRSREEARRRLVASPPPPAAPAPQPRARLEPEKAATMLSYASPNLWADVIDRLSGDDALTLVPKVENSELRDALIRHALNA